VSDAQAAAAPQTPAAVQLVRRPVWQLHLRGANVTAEISPSVRTVTYTDHSHGESDELEIEIADPEGVWRGGWMPEKGDGIDLYIGYEGEPLLPCGAFQVDEAEAAGTQGGGDTLTVRALAAGHTPALRTRRSHGYEGQTLRRVVETVAARHQLRVVGEVGDEHVGRVTQDRQSDTAFLTRLAERFGYVFSIRGTQLVFHRVSALESAPGTWSLRRAGILEYRLKSGSTAVYRACTVSYHDPATRQVVERTVTAEGVTTGDVHRMTVRVESAEQADQVASAELRRLNSRGAEGSVTVDGDPRLVAGGNGDLRGFGKFDGPYQVVTSRHTISRDAGYTTEIEVRSLGAAEHKPQERKHASRASRRR
jgi:phage protein D